MMSKNNLPAFSIIEAIVGMVITAIILSIVFVVFSIVSERLIDFKSQNNIINDQNRITYSLNKDIFENEKMQQIDKDIILVGYSGEKIRYSFLENQIIRYKENFLDTFQLSTKKISLDTIKNATQKKHYLQLNLDIEVNESEMKFCFFKRIYANELLEKTKE